MRSRLVFCGHFELGEIASRAHVESVIAAKRQQEQHGGDLGLFVSDIGFANKALAYLNRGAPGVAELYERRRSCAPTGCILAQLPPPEAVLGVVDEGALSLAIRELQQSDADLDSIDPFTPAFQVPPNIGKVIRKRIVPKLVAARVIEYGLDPTEAEIFLETTFRNVSHKRMKRTHTSHHQTSAGRECLAPWTQLFEGADAVLRSIYETEFRSPGGSPTCRAIMLALHERVSLSGYAIVDQYCPAKYLQAVQMATSIYSALGRRYPDDPRWSAKLSGKFLSSPM